MSSGISFDISLTWQFTTQKFRNIKDQNMENYRYESPKVEIIKMHIEQAVLASSFTGEDINTWEEM